jgi:hypothetical protein
MSYKRKRLISEEKLLIADERLREAEKKDEKAFRKLRSLRCGRSSKRPTDEQDSTE